MIWRNKEALLIHVDTFITYSSIPYMSKLLNNQWIISSNCHLMDNGYGAQFMVLGHYIAHNIYIYIYGLKNQYAPNFLSECLKPGVCIFALNLFGKTKTYFSQMFLKIHPRGPAEANGSLRICKKRSLLGVVLSALLSTPSKYL